MSVFRTLKEAESLHDLADLLGYKASGLSYLLYKLPDSKKYKKFTIPKRDGGEREICAPMEQMKTLQRRLANVLYACRDEIDGESGRGSLSHAFRRRHSIISNARRHKRRRYVLNLDLKEFFPSFNFGRVRGFFIRNNKFELNENVATFIAQIACFENSLPQGSPCSPIIADMIAHLLDVRLAQFAKKKQLTYSRYADDITFSTNKREFPASVAAPVGEEGCQWVIGEGLQKHIEKAGFKVNPSKTRMQFKVSRQLVTGLTVNDKVNIRPEYYKLARAMCHNLFQTGAYYKPVISPSNGNDGNGSAYEKTESLAPINGILSHIHHVKDLIDQRDEVDKRKEPTAARKLYARFLKYRYFVRLDKPLVVCEGKTDSIYLKLALRQLTQFHPELGRWDDGVFKSALAFFNYNNQAHQILELGGGTSDLKYFFIKNRYHRDIYQFKHRPLKHPVIVMVDNDDGAKKEIFPTLKKGYDIDVTTKSTDKYFHVTDNLYLIKTPRKGKSGVSCIEDFFDPKLLETEVAGKKLNLQKSHEADGEYGKYVFAEKVVRPYADTVDFSGFSPILEQISAVLEHYASLKTMSVLS